MRTKSILLTALCGAVAASTFAADPLPSWNDTAPKKAIIAFVEKVTKPGSPDFVPVPERIATFDNDGTLWCEQPMYFQLLFALDRVKQLAPQHPEWKKQDPFKKLLSTPKEEHVAVTEAELMQIGGRWLLRNPYGIARPWVASIAKARRIQQADGKVTRASILNRAGRSASRPKNWRLNC